MSNMKPNAVKGPIPPNTIRISIQYGEWVYVVDYPSAKMDSALSEFDDLAGRTIRELRGTMKELGTWKGDDVGARSMARYAREEGEYYLLAVASLWMFMNRPNPSDQARAEKAFGRLSRRMEALGLSLRPMPMAKSGPSIWPRFPWPGSGAETACRSSRPFRQATTKPAKLDSKPAPAIRGGLFHVQKLARSSPMRFGALAGPSGARKAFKAIQRPQIEEQRYELRKAVERIHGEVRR